MADDVDRLNDRAEVLFDAAIADIRRASTQSEALATGFCLWCGLVVTDNARWCDAQCRDEWEWFNDRRR